MALKTTASSLSMISETLVAVEPRAETSAIASGSRLSVGFPVSGSITHCNVIKENEEEEEQEEEEQEEEKEEEEEDVNVRWLQTRKFCYKVETHTLSWSPDR